jgi:hypothetical protein
MDLDRHLPALQEQLALAIDPDDERARVLAQRLTAPLTAAVKLLLLDVLSEAAAEITRELAPGSVELRLRSGEPEFAVVLPVVPEGATDAGLPPVPEPAAGGDGAVARFNLRLPEELKNRVEQAAAREGLSVNSWLVRAAAAAAGPGGPARPSDRAVRSANRYSGWV